MTLDRKSNSFADAIAKSGYSADPVRAAWQKYALTSTARGESLIAQLEEHFTGKLEGKRLLDIGFGHGGACIAAARRGAEVVGIDISDRNFELAQMNIAEAALPNIHLSKQDILTLNVKEALGAFDVIICDNVIEHVDDAWRLTFNISELLRQQGVAYVTAPNAFSCGQVLSECHYQIFGISLLDRFDATSLFEESGRSGRYEVGDYFPYASYHDMFEQCGLSMRQLVPLIGTDDIRAKLVQDIQKIRSLVSQLTNSEKPAAIKLGKAAEHYVSRVSNRCGSVQSISDLRLRHLYTRALHRDFMLGLWYFVLTKDQRLTAII